MKPIILREKCAAQPTICPPMKDCPQAAFIYIEDEDEPLGGMMEINPEKCDGCGICVSICCGNCIEMR